MKKKNLLFLAAGGALFALTACSSDDAIATNQSVEEANTISFRPLVNTVTRAADIDLSGLQVAGKGFFVTANHNVTTPSASTTTYFDNVQFKWNSTSNSFNSDTKYYWPIAGNLDFYAYAPTEVGNAQLTRTNYTTFTVNPSATISEQVDLIYACTKGKTKGANSAGVAINFRHAGAKIICKVKNSSTSLKFSVEGWKVGYLDTEGTFTFADANTDGNNTGSGTTLAYGDWSNNTTQSADNQYTSNIVSPVSILAKVTTPSVDEHETTLDGEMILVPQPINAATAYANSGTPAADDKVNGSFIAVKLKILNAENDAVIAADAGGNAIWAIWPIGGSAGSVKWEPGKKYTYTIDLAGGGYYEVNQAETPSVDADLDPILDGAEIKFVDVTVDAWGPAVGTDVTMP